MVAADNLNEFEAEVPEALRPRFREVAAIVDGFCDERLNAEYREVCRRILACFCQPGTAIHRGKAQSWAAGIVYEAGQVNFLTDPSSDPHLRAEEIAQGIGVSPATMHTKARDIRESLQLMRLDPSFTLPSRLVDSPLAWLMELPNGAIVNLKDMPEELRQKLQTAGLLPDDADQPAMLDWRERKLIPPPEPEPGLVFRLRIALDESSPPIWRRVEIPDCTLDGLHSVIQVAMGWEDCHLHEFEIGGRRFQTSEGFGVDAMWNAIGEQSEPTEDTLLSDLVPEGSKEPLQFRYLYDFGDQWRHTITVEGIEHREKTPVVPQCLDGAGACPPEDCGGVWGYLHLRDVLSDPNHPEHKELRDWYAGELRPEEFDPEEVNSVFRSWGRSRVIRH